MISKRSVFASLLVLSWFGIVVALVCQETFAAGSRENLAWLVLLWLAVCVLLTVSLGLRWHQDSPGNRATRTIAILSVMNLLTFIHIFLVLGLTNWVVAHGNNLLASAVKFTLGVLTIAVGAFAPVALVCALLLITSGSHTRR